MAKSKLEYIWLDGHKPTQNMRSKTKLEEDFSGRLEDCPLWSFDGSSTEQAEGITQVNKGLNQIDQVTQQNTALAEESAAAAEELSSTAEIISATAISSAGRFNE